MQNDQPSSSYQQVAEPKRKGILFYALVLLGIGGALFWGIPQATKSFAKYIIVKELRTFGIKNVDLSRVSVSLKELTISDIHVHSARGYVATKRDDYLIIDEIKAIYNPLRLITNGFDQIKIKGLSLWIEEGYFQSYFNPDQLFLEGQDLTQPKSKTITIENSEIIFAFGEDRLKIPFEGSLSTSKEQPIHLTSQWSALGKSTAQGNIEFALNKNNEFSFSLNTELVKFEGMTLKGELHNTTFKSDGKIGDNHYVFDVSTTINNLDAEGAGQLKQPILLTAKAAGELNKLSTSLQLKFLKEDKPFITFDGGVAPLKAIGSGKVIMDIPDLASLVNINKINGKEAKIDGGLKISGDFDWQRDWLKPTVDLTATLENIHITYDEISAANLNGVLKITSLLPFTTRNHQVIKSKTVKFRNIVFEDTKLEFYASPLLGLSINHFAAKAFGGQITAHSFRRSPKIKGNPLSFEVSFKDIHLQSVLKMADIQGLSGEGRLAGAASLKIVDDELKLTKAQIRSTSSQGSIQYQPETQKEAITTDLEGAELALEVLKNLQFTVLDVNLGVSPSDETDMQASVKILGFNPKVLNGYPFEFNITTSGKLGDLVLNTLKNIRPPKDLQELNTTFKKSQGATQS